MAFNEELQSALSKGSLSYVKEFNKVDHVYLREKKPLISFFCLSSPSVCSQKENF